MKNSYIVKNIHHININIKIVDTKMVCALNFTPNECTSQHSYWSVKISTQAFNRSNPSNMNLSPHLFDFIVNTLLQLINSKWTMPSFQFWQNISRRKGYERPNGVLTTYEAVWQEQRQELQALFSQSQPQFKGNFFIINATFLSKCYFLT